MLEDAIAIWKAGTAAVEGASAVRSNVAIDGKWLTIEAEAWNLKECQRIVVVGGGKATASMAEGLLDILTASPFTRDKIVGWINVPEGTFEPRKHRPIHYFAARPPGANEPTLAAMQGAHRIMDLAASTTRHDLFLCLLSGGGSALLPLPVDGVSLDDKLETTRFLSGRGAPIEELNCVRRAISRIKAGGLARACGAKNRCCLVLSDVLGDPLESIASGPCWLDKPPNYEDAFNVLSQYDPDQLLVPKSVYDSLARSTRNGLREQTHVSFPHFIIANNATAVDAAGTEAVARGYAYWMQSARQSEGDIAEVADRIVQHLDHLWHEGGPDCLVLGGEPTVTLPSSGECGRGGRNQQLVLELLIRLIEPHRAAMRENLVFLSGGTDGEDGPTDAAGAWCNADILRRMESLRIDPKIYRDRCDAYSFFEAVNGLLKTGPTNTNVCDLRIAILKR